MEKNFSLYLTKIGFLDEKESKEVINLNNEIKNKPFIDSSFHYLMNFFDNLNESQKKYMSYFIPNNYKQITKKLREKKLKSIFIHKILNYKMILLKNLYKWKRNINKDNNEKNHKSIYDENNKLTKILQASQNTTSLDDYILKEKMNKKKDITNIKNILNTLNIKAYKSKNERKFNILKNERYPYNYYSNHYQIDSYKTTIKQRKPDYNYIFNNLYQTSISKKDLKNKNKLLTSLESKELEDLKECTFKPRINASSPKPFQQNSNGKNKSKENIMSIFDKLYKDEEKIKLSKELKTIDMEYNLGKNFSFTPNLNKRFKKIYKYQEHKNFVQRQREYMEKLDKKKEEMRDEIDSRNELICSFNPKITNKKGEYYVNKKKKSSEKNKKPSSVFKRLYLDVENRQNIKEQKEQENINKFKEMSNYLTLNKKINDSELLERLLDYNKEDIMNKTREKVEKEEGITFQPEIGDDDYIRNVEGNFFERNEQWELNRNNFLEEENAKQIENLRNSAEGNNKKYTREEREQIISNIVERLYKINKDKKNKEENEDSEQEEEKDNNENEDSEQEEE